jgi:excisionase family DNA binding protein
VRPPKPDLSPQAVRHTLVNKHENLTNAAASLNLPRWKLWEFARCFPEQEGRIEFAAGLEWGGVGKPNRMEMVFREQAEEAKMSRSRTKLRKSKPPSAPTNGVETPATDVLTLSEAAAYLRVTESELLCLVHDQALPGRQFGTQWRFLKSAIQDWLKTPPKSGSREAVLSTYGSMKDDPYLMEELKEIYRRRGRPMTENEE